MILLTGGAGFIGSCLLHQLNLLDRTDVIVVDRLETTDKWKNLAGLKYDRYIHADELFTTRYQEVVDLADKISVIYHMGACSSTTERDMDFLMKNNVEFSQKLCTFATNNEIPFIYASSAATYGAGEQGYNDQEDISLLRPLNPYGYSKQVFDEWMLRQEKLPKIWYGLKFFNVFGPNEYHKGHMRSVVQKAYEQIKNHGEVKLFKSHRDDFEDGEQKRDFVYVKDIVKAMIGLIDTANGKNPGIYNLGTGKARTFLDLVLATFKAMNKKTQIDYIDMPENIRDQYQYFTEANMEKLQKILPQMKFSTLEDSIKDYVQNHLMQDNPYLDIKSQ